MQYFNARAWGAFGLSLEQISFLQELTSKINTIEAGATADLTDQEVQDKAQPLVNSMTFMLMGA